jgi:hypothetical protein
MFIGLLHSLPTFMKAVRRGETSVISGDGFVPEATFMLSLEKLKSVFRPFAGRKEEFSW